MEEGAAPDSKPVVYRMPCAAEHDLDELTVYETKHRIFIIAKCVHSRKNPSDTNTGRQRHAQKHTSICTNTNKKLHAHSHT
jgi:hypothetical protein